MSAKLLLESATDTLDLDYVLHNGRGVQVLSGVTGLGLPPVSVRWLEGAGDGATFRGRRVLPRDIDLPLLIVGTDRGDLINLTNRLADVLAGQCKLRMVDDTGESWWCDVWRVGGGDYTYGVDTIGETELQLVITLRAGDPFWTAERPQQQPVGAVAVATAPILANFVTMQLSPGDTAGVVTLENIGDTYAYPVWELVGPGENFQAVSPSGEVLQWDGALAAGETLTIDTMAGTVIDSTGANRYSELATAPRLWTVPPGTSEAAAALLSTTSESRIAITWRPRRWLVV